MMSILLVISCLLACNTDRFKPKPEEQEIQTPTSELTPELTIEQEVDEELIGPAQLDYSDLDESGDGIYGRKLSDTYYAKLEAIKTKADPNLKGTLRIICCIDQSGSIMMARPDVENTSMNDLSLQRKVGKMLFDERFESRASAPERQCGLVIVEF